MNPIAFRIPLPFLGTSLNFTWYGISIVVGVLAAASYGAYAAKRKGEDPNNIWDMFIYLLVFGVIGARIWFIVTATLGGNRYYLENPLQMLNIPAGGTNIFGGLMFGVATLFVFAKMRGINPWAYLDFLGPGVLLGQGLARWGNFVNQELYGPPTTLPWGIPIDAAHRIPPWNDLAQFPLSTRFHPTFLYETIFDLLAFAVLLLLIRRFDRWWKTGSIFGAYLVFHGIGRFIIECFRPDQPRIVGTDISYSRLLSVLFVMLGAALIYWRQRRTETAKAAAALSDEVPEGAEGLSVSPTIQGDADIGTPSESLQRGSASSHPTR